MAAKVESASLASAMKLLREQIFDVVILHHDEQLNALEAIGLVRAAAPDHLAIIVMGERPSNDMTAQCMDASADAYVCRTSTDVRTLLWTLARAAERQSMIREVLESREAFRQHQTQQHQDAISQLRSQRSVLLEHIALSMDVDPCPPEWLVDKLLEMLRLMVVSGTGKLHDEVEILVARLEHSEVTLIEALSASYLAAEQLILGLGSRPAWHIVGRTNMLVLELTLHMKQAPV